MKKNYTKKIALLLVISAIAAAFPSTAALPSISESEIEEICTCPGMDPNTTELLEIRENPNLVSTLSTAAVSSLPSSYDISTSAYFPPISSQLYVGSCGAWASTYYQFTYTANALNRITSTSSNAYSPQWPYYYLRTTAEDKGVMPTDVYPFLSEHGSLTMEDCPCDETFDDSLPLPTNTSKMREALGTRLSTWYTSTIPSAGTAITSPTDSDLNEVKTLLSSGIVLVVSSQWNFNKVRVNNELINYRCSRPTAAAHAFAIVGYNDALSYDINGNGTIETAERGAFKIANSHGTNYGNNGFAWVMYDALNGTSAVSGSWENSLSGTRVPAFKFRSDDNYFSYIFVQNYDVNFVAELKFTSTIRNTVSTQLTSVSSSGTSKTRTPVVSPCTPVSSTFTLLYDYSTIGSPVSSYALDSTLGIKLTGTKKDLSSGKITDDRGNTLKTLSSTSTSGTYTANISFDRGDVNYDGSLNSSDATLITQYITGHDNLSNVQFCLADYNNDGTVNMLDAISLAS